MNYKLSNDAKNDLIRIHQRGVRDFGETQADKYYYALFERFSESAICILRKDYRCLAGSSRPKAGEPINQQIEWANFGRLPAIPIGGNA